MLVALLIGLASLSQEAVAQNCNVNAITDQTLCANATVTLVGSTSTVVWWWDCQHIINTNKWAVGCDYLADRFSHYGYWRYRRQ